MATRLEIAELYVATFNRAADADGLAYWISDGTANTTDLTSLQDLSSSMIASAEYTALYGANPTDEALVIALYANVLNRTVDGTDAGVVYWVGELASGNVIASSMVTTIINGAKADTGSATDKATIENKATVGLDFADSGLNDVTTATTIMSSVTSDTATVTTAATAIDAAVLAVAQAAAIQLTTSTDSFVGTDGNDVWNSVNGTLATADTILDSSSADADVLYAEVTSAGAAPRLQNIETINVTGKYTTAGIDLASVAGTTDLNVNSNILGGTATVTNASSLNALNINAGANIGTVSVTATASGTRDTVYVDAGSATTITVAGGAGADLFDVTMAAASAATFNGAGSVDAYTVHVGATATISGNAATEAITIDAASDSVVTLGAVLTDTVTNVATAKTTVTGAGNVTIKGTNAQLTDTAVVNAGSGDLTVTVTDAAVAADLKAVAATTVNLAVDPTVGTVTVNEGSFVNLQADTTGTLQVDNTAGTLTTGTLLLNVSQNSSSITTGSKVSTLLIAATPDAATDTDADGNGTAETHIVVTALDTATGTNTETVIITGSADLEIATLTNDVTASVLSATGMTGDLTIGTTTAAGTYVLGSGTNSVTVGNVASTIHGGSGVDTITGGTAADTINGNAGNDIIAGGATGLNTIDAGAGDDAVTVTGTATDTITLGTGSDTVTSAVNLDFTISDLNTAEDTVVITGAAAAAVDLTNTTPATGTYDIGTAGADDFTITGSTATDISSFVQLGNATTDYVLFNASTNVAGVKDDHVAVATTEAATIATGAGSDTVELQVVTGGVTTTAVTVTDFTVGSDKVLVTGVGDAATAIDLTSITPASGVYTLGTTQTADLSTGGTAIALTDATTFIQLGDATTAFTAGATSGAITGGVFNDYIAGGGGADAINFINGGGYDTITAFKTAGADTLSFDALTGIGATGTTVAANAAKLTDAVDGSVYAFDDASDGTGSEAISTFTVNAANGITADTILADVASFLNAALGTTTGESYVAVINNTAGTQAYAYTVAGDTTGITADDISLIGAITSASTIVAADIA